jgi:hypothetical protein
VKVFRAIASFLILTAFIPPVNAQETGTLIQRKAAQIDTRDANAARLTMQNFASCIASRSKGRLTKLLSLPVGTPDYDRLSRAMFDREGDECLSGGELSFSMKLLRGSFFEAVYLQEFGRDVITDFADVTDSGYRARYAEPYGPEAAYVIVFEQFGECVVRARTAAVRDLVISIPGSSKESSAFAVLAPALGPCLPKGRKIAFSKPVLRGFVSEGLYWLSAAKRSMGGVVK